MASTERAVRASEPRAARAWIDEQRRAWRERSRRLGAWGADQLHPCTTLHYLPPRPRAAPLLLLGGMGPLAGLEGFEHAIAREPGREIVLHQACHLPCRTQAIAAEARGDGSVAEAVVAGLYAAFDDLLPRLGRREGELMVLCNTAHYFLPRVSDRLPAGVRLHPLPHAAVAAAARLAPRRLMLLTSEGTRLSGLYARAATAAGVAWSEPDEEAHRLLQRAIFRGVKGGDEAALVADGDALVRRIAGDRPDALLAGCTEIPIIIAALRTRGSPATRSYLERVAVIDPVVETLNALSYPLDNEKNDSGPP